jgi:hypothetical protein
MMRIKCLQLQSITKINKKYLEKSQKIHCSKSTF